jgi:hypothetical protein
MRHAELLHEIIQPPVAAEGGAPDLAAGLVTAIGARETPSGG